MAITPKGVRMINENVLQPGRAVIITDPESVEWNHIPDGSLYVNPETGVMQVKRHGETSWTPMDGWGDDTLVISRDTSLCVEVFTVTSLDNGDGTFTYKNAKGEQRYKPKLADGYVFELENGTYINGRNHLTVTFDDVLERSAASGGVVELDSTRFKITENIPVGTELTVRYIKWVRIGNPYPRIFENEDQYFHYQKTADTVAKPNKTYYADDHGTPLPVQPVVESDISALDYYEATWEPEEAHVGDFWLDRNNDENSIQDMDLEDYEFKTIRWSDITEIPHTLGGYGINDAAPLIHKHYAKDIQDLDAKIQEKINLIGDVNAKQLQDLIPDKEYKATPTTIAVYDGNGKLPLSAIPVHQQFQVGMIMDWYGNSAAAPKGWAICDGRTQNGIKTPDLRGRFIIGGGTSGTYIGSTRTNNDAAPVKSGGVATIKIQKANLPPHDHTHTHKHRHNPGDMNLTGTFGTGGNTPSIYKPDTSGVFTNVGVNGRQYAGAQTSQDDRTSKIKFTAKGNWKGNTGWDETKNSTTSNADDFKGEALSIIPPYVALFKIMYVGV